MAAAAFHHRQQRRRETLEGLRSANATKSSGSGLSPRDEILLGSFRNRRTCRRLLAELDSRGIAARTKRGRIQVAVYVRVADRAKAFELLQELKKTFPDTRPRGMRRDYDWTLLCSTLTLVVTACMFASSQHVSVMLSLAYLLSGVCVGVVLDRCQRNHRYYDRYQFSTGEILGLIGIVAMLCTVWRVAMQF